MFRLLSLSIGLTTCMLFSGCMGVGCYQGCGQQMYDCDNCDGYSRNLSGNVFQRTRSALACGSGCGDMYVGEWRNYPPNNCNPCDSAAGCRPFLSSFGLLLGRRTHECETCYGGDERFFRRLDGPYTPSCGCDDGLGSCAGGVCASGACAGSCAGGSYGGSIDYGVPGATGGCTSCNVDSHVNRSRPTNLRSASQPRPSYR